MKTALCVLLICTGCSTTYKRLLVTQARIAEAAREEAQAAGLAIDRTRQDIAAARALSPENASLTSADYAAAAAARLAGRTEALLGPPAASQVARVESMLSTNAAARAQSQAQEQARESALSADLRAQRIQEAVLVEKGKIYEQERNRGIVRRIWTWTISTLGIGGLIALCIFFPAIIPIMGQLVGWIVSRVPAVSSWIGLVGKRSYERVVTAVQEIKLQAAASGKADAEALARKVAAESTSKDALLVKHVKDGLDY